jgi:hypothetical protein
MDDSTKDWVDAISKIAGVLGVFVAILVARHQFGKSRQETKRDREQREEELRWRKASLARDVLNELWEDQYANDAMLMLDWSNREYNIAKDTAERITRDEVWTALRTAPTNFTTKEKYIRDCFDHFFGAMQIIEHYISINLVEFEDVKYPFNYFAGKLSQKREVVETFLETYEYDKATAFLRRLDKWGKA